MFVGEKDKKYSHLFFFTLCLLLPCTTKAFFFDWFWTQSGNQHAFIDNNGPFVSIPFEFKAEDEKFLEEATKFTDLMKTSSLDVCQHKVILQIKTSCFSMTEEDLAKMSVNLLNCQSQVDGRSVFPCTESMTLKECTKDMDANMWNAYHLMNNRARAVCLVTRRTQFQALSEMTVNKLMATAHDQIKKMTNLLEGQEKLELLTQDTLQSVQKGHIELKQQQNNLKNTQKKIQDFVEFNLEQLLTEKALIAAGNKELAEMTQTIKQKLDETSQQLNRQSTQTAESHNGLLKDLEVLQLQARGIFKRIDSSTERLLAQQEIASRSYKSTMDNLTKINETIYHILNMINGTRNEINDRFYWIQDFLNGTGSHLEKLLSVTFHIIYLLLGMLFASFLNFSCTSRALLAVVVPLNLFVTFNRGPETALDLSQVTLLLGFSISFVAIAHRFYTSSYRPRRCNIFLTQDSKKCSSPSVTQTPIRPQNNIHSNARPIQNGITRRLSKFLEFVFGWVGKRSRASPSSTERDDNFISSTRDDRNGSLNDVNEFSSLSGQFQHSVDRRVNDWLQSKVEYPRSGSPSTTTSGSPKSYCAALCRSGRRCKNTTHLGHDVCYRHMWINAKDC